jgi:hypothetical protein
MRYKYHRLSHYLSSSSLSAPLYSKNSESLGPCFALLPQLFENVLLVYTCLPLSIAVHPKIQNRLGMSCVSASLNQVSKKMELMLCGSFWTVSRGLYILLNFLSWLSPSHSAISLFPKFPCKVPHAMCLSLSVAAHSKTSRGTLHVFALFSFGKKSELDNSARMFCPSAALSSRDAQRNTTPQVYFCAGACAI